MLAQILSARPTGGLKLTDEELLNSAIDPEMLETEKAFASSQSCHANRIRY